MQALNHLWWGLGLNQLPIAFWLQLRVFFLFKNHKKLGSQKVVSELALAMPVRNVHGKLHRSLVWSSDWAMKPLLEFGHAPLLRLYPWGYLIELNVSLNTSIGRIGYCFQILSLIIRSNYCLNPPTQLSDHRLFHNGYNSYYRRLIGSILVNRNVWSESYLNIWTRVDYLK